jgi:hypothetical protein
MDQEALNLNEVDKEAGFSHFDSGLTEQDQERLAKIRVNTKDTYDNFGDVGRIRADAAEFFEKLGNSPAEARMQADIALRLVEKAIKGFGSEAAWVSIRAFLPTDDFDVPRWHMDGKFYETTGDQLKAVFTLKGASALLHKASTDQRKKILQLQRAASEGKID